MLVACAIHLRSGVICLTHDASLGHAESVILSNAFVLDAPRKRGHSPWIAGTLERIINYRDYLGRTRIGRYHQERALPLASTCVSVRPVTVSRSAYRFGDGSVLLQAQILYMTGLLVTALGGDEVDVAADVADLADSVR